MRGTSYSVVSCIFIFAISFTSIPTRVWHTCNAVTGSPGGSYVIDRIWCIICWPANSAEATGRCDEAVMRPEGRRIVSSRVRRLFWVIAGGGIDWGCDGFELFGLENGRERINRGQIARALSSFNLNIDCSLLIKHFNSFIVLKPCITGQESIAKGF